MKLYTAGLSPYSARCRIQIYAKGLDVELVSFPDEISVEELTALTPMHKVPTLEVDGLIIPESETICEYLEETQDGVPLRPEDAASRARVRLLSRICDLYIMKPMGELFGQINPKDRNEARVTTLMAELERSLGWLEFYLDGSAYAVGDKLSLCDCALMPALFFVEEMGPMFGRTQLLKSRPAVLRYFEATASDDHVARVLDEMSAALKRMTAA